MRSSRLSLIAVMAAVAFGVATAIWAAAGPFASTDPFPAAQPSCAAPDLAGTVVDVTLTDGGPMPPSVTGPATTRRGVVAPGATWPTAGGSSDRVVRRSGYPYPGMGMGPMRILVNPATVGVSDRGIGAQGGHEQREKRHRLLILERLTQQGAHPGLVGQRHHLGQQPTLPDARRALDDQHTTTPLHQRRHQRADHLQLASRPNRRSYELAATSERPVEGPTGCPVYRLLNCHCSAVIVGIGPSTRNTHRCCSACAPSRQRRRADSRTSAATTTTGG